MPISIDLLDLLVDGPSHVAGLYASLRKHVRDVAIEDFTAAIRELGQQGLVRLWLHEAGSAKAATAAETERALACYEAELSTADLDALYHDEIGLWCEITGDGRKQWEDAGYEEELDGVRWTLDEAGRQEARALTIHAETEYAAERVLSWWLARHSESGSATDIAIKPVPSFTLRDGSTVSGGVQLTCRIGTD